MVRTVATTGADPAEIALAALILLPVGGAAVATSAVISRRKNAAWFWRWDNRKDGGLVRRTPSRAD